MNSLYTVKTRTFSLYPSEHNLQAKAGIQRDGGTIGKNRLSILLCAWIACVFMFVVVAARMFYGADTTGDLKTAEGSLRSPPTVHASGDATQPSDSNSIQQVSHSVFGPRPTPTAAGYSDAFYGQTPSAPSKSRPEAARANANSERRLKDNAPAYSIIPDHALNRSKQPDQTPIMIRPDDRITSGPSWSVLPGSSNSSKLPNSISTFSQLPAHRLNARSSATTAAPEPKAGSAKLKDQKKDSAKEADTSDRPQRSFPLITPPPIPRSPKTLSNLNLPPEGRNQARANTVPTLSISSTNPNGDLLSIPSNPTGTGPTATVPTGANPTGTGAILFGQDATDQLPPDVGSADPVEGLQSPQRFEAPIQMSPVPGVSDLQRLYNQEPQINSGWSDFSNSAVRSNSAWWESKIAGPLYPDRQPMYLTLAACLSVAQTNSPELQVLHSDWYIQQAESDRLAAAFDWNTFVEAIWNRDSTPVGSDLDGATNRLRSRTGNSSFGIRRQTETGAELEISQQFGTRSGNSVFLNPNPQATSRLQFDYQKPLLRGFGEDYNTSPQKLAGIARDTAYDRFRIGVQDYLLNVSSAYWSVVLQRGIYLQAQASLDRVQQISNEMAARIEVDVTPGMLDRARSEVAIRKANLIQARYDVLRVQSALLRLIYGSNFSQFANHEVVTSTLPLKRSVHVQPEDKVQAALQQRSEVHQAIREIKAATIRYDVAANEVLPALNLVLSGYVAGLDAGDDVGTSWTNQFSEGEPGVGIGFDFEVPYRNRAAEALAERQQITIKRVQAALQTVIANVGEDVRNQVIERNKFGDMLNDQQEAIIRVRSLLKNATIRREQLADGNQVADLYLENLLQIQNRLEATESAYLQSQVRYSLADNALLRALAEIDSIAGDVGQVSSTNPVIHGANVVTPTIVPSTTGHSFRQ